MKKKSTGPQHKFSSRELMGSESFGVRKGVSVQQSHISNENPPCIVEFPMIFLPLNFLLVKPLECFFFFEVPVGRPSVTMEVVVGYLVILMVWLRYLESPVERSRL